MSRRETRLGIALVLVGLLVASGAAYLIVSEIRGVRAERELEEGLARVDRLIDDGQVQDASELVLGLVSRVPNAEGALSVVKRSYRIAGRTGDFNTAAEVARRSVGRHPSNAELTAAAIHASLRAGRAEFARELLEEAPDTERFDALRAETAIRIEGAPEEDTRAGRFDFLATLSRSSPASDFARAFDLTEDARFAVDEALRNARGGDLESGLAALEDRNIAQNHPVMTGLLAYDLERYDMYEDMLQQMEPAVSVSAEQLMLQADIAMLRRKYGSAKSIYTDVRRSEPAFSAEAYLNGAWIVRSDREEARSILDERAGMFDSHTGIARAEVLLSYERNPEVARSELREYVAQVSRPGELATLEMHLFERQRGSVSSFVSRLWNTANEYPESPFPYRYLGRYLVSVNHWSELEVLVDRADGVVGEELLGLYRGMLAAREHEWDRARSLFYDGENKQWQAAFNAGLAALADGSSGEAHELFDTALELLSGGAGTGRGDGEQPANRARVLIFDALAYAVGGDYSQAYGRVSEAVEIDPTNPRARYLMTNFADRID